MIKDIVHGATIDRVFSKTVTFKNHELRCSDGVILPRSFLDLMEPKQRSQALALFEKGYLIVQICSATTFFSKRNKQLREAKSKLIQSDVCRQYYPEEVTESEGMMSRKESAKKNKSTSPTN